MGASFSHHAQGGSGRTVLACPTPAASTPPTNPAPEPAMAGNPATWPTSLAPSLAPEALSACHGIHRPPVPRAGQTARPGIQEGCNMTEASVSFAGNLTDDPEVRYTEGSIARLGVRSECAWHAASRATPSPSPSPSGSVVSSPSP